MKKHQHGMKDLLKKGRIGTPMSERIYDKPEYGVRPRMLQFVECENVLIGNVKLQNSPLWTIHLALLTSYIGSSAHDFRMLRSNKPRDEKSRVHYKTKNTLAILKISKCVFYKS